MKSVGAPHVEMWIFAMLPCQGYFDRSINELFSIQLLRLYFWGRLESILRYVSFEVLLVDIAISGSGTNPTSTAS